MPRGERVVLVTGAAGFIGFHISRRLVQDWGVKQVVAVDTFNSYYDVQLKMDRATELVRMGVKVCCHEKWARGCTLLRESLGIPTHSLERHTYMYMYTLFLH